MYSYLEFDSAHAKTLDLLSERARKIDLMKTRFTHVEKTTRKHTKIMVPDSLKRLEARLNTVGVFSHHEPCTGDSFSAGFAANIDNQIRYCHAFYPITNRFLQEPRKLNIAVSNIVITKHAILRFMQHNKTLDALTAIQTLTNATHKLNTNIAKITVLEKQLPQGSHERQVFCSDGGIAIIKIDKVEDSRYQDMNWAVVTYISKKMVRDFNVELTNTPFDGDTLPVSDLDLGRIEWTTSLKDGFW
ncbi:hypothetical protein AB4254_11720 [Vibrio breoganii]